MNDDLESAEAHLNKGTSPFHQLGSGVCMFMRATLGFEQETMREGLDTPFKIQIHSRLTHATAANTLYQAECAAYESQKRAAKDPNAYQSSIYPPGTEYAVSQAEAQLMSAVVGLLNESLTEAIKSFYKLRKAYLALEVIMENERNFLKKRSTSSLNTAGSGGSLKGGMARSKTGSLRSKAGTSAGASTTSLKQTVPTGTPAVQKEAAPGLQKVPVKDDDDDEFDFQDAEENNKGNVTPGEYGGHLKVSTGKDGSIASNNEKKVDLESTSASGLPSTHNNPSIADERSGHRHHSVLRPPHRRVHTGRIQLLLWNASTSALLCPTFFCFTPQDCWVQG
jgi:hypothetical protein